MKKKVIALMCAFSLICTNIGVFAENANEQPETEIQLAEEMTEETEKVAESDDEIVLTEEEETLDTVADEEIEILSETSEEEQEEVLLVDKTELLAVLEEASSFTEEMLGEAFDEFADVIQDAQSVAEDENATEDEVAYAVLSVTGAMAEAERIIRNGLFELLRDAKSVDKKLTTKESYEIFEAAYNAAEKIYWDKEKNATEIINAKNALAEAMAAIEESKKVVILTDNVSTDEEKAHYPGVESDALPDITYKYLPGGNPGLLTNDPECNKLFDGLKESNSTANVVFGNWDQHQITEIVFDLGESAYVSGVDVWEYKKFDYCKVGLVEVHLSDDGVRYTLAGKITRTNDYTTSMLLNNPVEFEPTKCRFIKLRVKDASCHQLILNEVVIHGYRCSQAGNTPVYFAEIDYKNENGDRVICLENENEITVSGKVVNNKNELMPCKVITAAYADGTLLDLDIKSLRLAAFEKCDITMSVDLGGAESAEIYTYVWNNFKDMEILSEIEGFGLMEHTTASLPQDGEGAAFDTESVRLTAWGTSEAKTGLCDVSLIVLKAGVLSEDTVSMSDSSLENAILYIEQAKPDGSGKYGFEFFPADVSVMYGNNNVYVKEKDAPNAEYYRLLFFDNAGERALLQAFKKAAEETDAVKMRDAIDTYRYIFAGINFIDRMVEKYGEENLLSTISTMLTTAEFEVSEDVVKEIIAAVALMDINNLETKEEVIDAILAYGSDMGIDDNGIFENYYAGDKNEEFREEISDAFVNQSYVGVKAFEYDFCETIVLDVLNNVVNYTEVKNLLNDAEEYLDNLGFDYDGYKKLSSSKQKRVCQAMAKAKGDYTNFESVKDKFNDTVENPGEDKTYGGSSGGGGGSFSGSASSGGGLPLTGVKTSDIEVFSDLGSVLWAKESILALYKNGIVSGTTDAKFEPNANITREQFAKMLVCQLGVYDASASSDFADAEKGAWYDAYVASAKNNGIVSGISGTEFGVGAKITRQDMAVMVYNALLIRADKIIYDRSQIADFTDDAEISEYAKEAVYAMRGLGIMQGRGNNAFCAKETATRAEAAKIIHILMGE